MNPSITYIKTGVFVSSPLLIPMSSAIYVRTMKVLRSASFLNTFKV